MRHPRTWWRGRRARRSARWTVRCSRASGSTGRRSLASRPKRWPRVRVPGRTGLRIREARSTSRAVRSRSRRSCEWPPSARAPAQSPIARAPFDLVAQLRSSPIVRSTVAAASRHVRPRAETPARSDPSGSLLAVTLDPPRGAGGGGSSGASVRSPGACARWSGDSPGPAEGPRPADRLVAADRVPTGRARHPGRPARRARGLRGDRAHRPEHPFCARQCPEEGPRGVRDNLSTHRKARWTAGPASVFVRASVRAQMVGAVTAPLLPADRRHRLKSPAMTTGGVNDVSCRLGQPTP